SEKAMISTLCSWATPKRPESRRSASPSASALQSDPGCRYRLHCSVIAGQPGTARRVTVIRAQASFPERVLTRAAAGDIPTPDLGLGGEIGRASCRERVEVWVG